MSWLNQVKNNLIIRCGDGKQFTPNWLNATKEVEYNVTEFSFPELKGTLVDRREVKGAKYSLEIYFQGEDHLQTSRDFEKSSEDKRYWVISHPFYGLLYVQPISLKFDNSVYNITKITGVVAETLTDSLPKPSIVQEDKIDEDSLIAQDLLAEGLTDPDQDLMSDSLESLYVTSGPLIADPSDFEKFFNAINNARDKINNVYADATAAMRAVQTAINAPLAFKQDMESKLKMLAQNFDSLTTQISGAINTIANLPNSLKNTFESFGGSIIASLCNMVAQPRDTDYKSRAQVNKSISEVLRVYNSYIDTLDTLQSGTGGNPTDFIPNADTIIQLNELVNYTLASLFDIAYNAKQERVHTLEEDSNYILLTHRFYGLDLNDQNLNDFIELNNLGLKSMLNIKKGTEITYLV